MKIDQTAGQYLCTRCNQALTQDEQAEHEDWHLAVDLQAQEREGPGVHQPPIQSSQPAKASDYQRADDKKETGLPSYAPPSYPPPAGGASRAKAAHHTNQVIEAAKIRERDEQEMQNALQSVQFQYRIYNSDIEPEHDTEYYCSCAICSYQKMKWRRYKVQDMWSRAVMYPGQYAPLPSDNAHCTVLIL